MYGVATSILIAMSDTDNTDIVNDNKDLFILVFIYVDSADACRLLTSHV